MKRYERQRSENNQKAKVYGISLSILLHAVFLLIFLYNGLTYISPPPQEVSFIMDFTETQKKEIIVKKQRIAQNHTIKEKEKTKKVQEAKSNLVSKKINKSQEAKLDEFGDVEKETIKQKKEIDKRALFPSANNHGDSLARQTASKISDALKAGQAEGNSSKGQIIGASNAKLKGRSVLGSLPKPIYNTQEEGIVVVTIWVDQYGNVKKAKAGAKGTTTTSPTLRTNARNAAMKAHFNTSASAPSLQQGTITYRFKLN